MSCFLFIFPSFLILFRSLGVYLCVRVGATSCRLFVFVLLVLVIFSWVNMYWVIFSWLLVFSLFHIIIYLDIMDKKFS